MIKLVFALRWLGLRNWTELHPQPSMEVHA